MHHKLLIGLIAALVCIVCLGFVYFLGDGSDDQPPTIDNVSNARPQSSIADAFPDEPGILAGQFLEDDEDPNLRRMELAAPPLKLGEFAPTFDLLTLDGDSVFRLKAHRGNKPVVLFFGSYT